MLRLTGRRGEKRSEGACPDIRRIAIEMLTPTLDQPRRLGKSIVASWTVGSLSPPTLG